MKLKVLILCADSREFRPSLSSEQVKNTSKAGVAFDIKYTGIGCLNVVNCLYQIPLDELVSYDLILSVGTAASLKHFRKTIHVVNVFNSLNLSIGEQPIAFVRKDFSINSVKTFVLGLNKSALTSPMFISKDGNRDRIDYLSTFDIIDMESYYIAHFLYNLKQSKAISIPFYGVKIISDNCEGSLKDWEDSLDELRPLLEAHVFSFLENLNA